MSSIKTYFKNLAAAIIGQVKTDLEQEIKDQLAKVEEKIEALGYESARPHEQDLTICPSCGGEANNGHDRSSTPVPYLCTKCV